MFYINANLVSADGSKNAFEENAYARAYLSKIKATLNDDVGLIQIINKIYENGFEDGCNERICSKKN